MGNKCSSLFDCETCKYTKPGIYCRRCLYDCSYSGWPKLSQVSDFEPKISEKDTKIMLK